MPICVGEGVISFPLDVPVSHRYTTVKHILKIRGVLTHVARIAVRVLLALASVAVLLVAAATAWLFVCASDLPNVQAMSSFAPQAPTNIPDASICGEKARVIALPTSRMTDVRNAHLAAEGGIDERGTRCFPSPAGTGRVGPALPDKTL